jgi:hypothetical protein
VRLHEVENQLAEVVKEDDVHCVEQVGRREVTHKPVNMLKPVETSVHMGRHQFRITYIGVAIPERGIYVVIWPEALAVSRDIISELVLWKPVRNTAIPIEIMLLTILISIWKPC